MNRRSFFKALLAVPAAAALAPLVPAPVRASLAERMEMALHLFWNRPQLVSRQTFFDSAGFTRKEDISEFLFASLKPEQTITLTRGMSMGVYSSPEAPKDSVYLLDRDRMVTNSWEDPFR